MSYRNDQFFNLPTGTEIGAEDIVHAPDNPPFIYPSRVVRTIDEKGNPSTRILQRGYIRSLANSIGGVDYPIKKCAFQFNPATIQQMVSQNDSMLNFIQQDPGQYIQPMPGNVNFAFELMFDRSMELNQQARPPSHAQLEGAIPVTDLNPWELEDAGEVGVLRDLAAFYAAVGQGMSQSQKAYVLQALTQTIQREAAAQVTSDGATPTSPDTAISALPTFLDMNVGNSAFLLPLPVRVVFSSLYIVEGLVQNTSVTFTKFNTSMVPMQCVLGVTMEAKYIGFAKKRTFLAVALEDQKTQFEQEAKSEQDQIASVYSSMASAAGSMEIALIPSALEGGADLGAVPADGTWPPDNIGFRYLDEALYTPNPEQFRMSARLPNAAFNPGSRANSQKPVPVQNITDLGISTLTVDAKVEIYGPIAALPSQNTASLKAAAQRAQLVLTGTLTSNRATTNNDWTKVTKGSSTGEQRRSTGPQPNSGFYITRYSGTVTAEFTTSSGTAQRATGTGEVWTVAGPAAIPPFTVEVHNTVPMTWTSPSATPTTTAGTVPPDNAATKPKAPGATSKVGATPLKGPR